MEVDDDNEHTQPCAQCAKPFADDEESVECFGSCRLQIHKNCLPGASPEHIEMLRMMPNAVFVCNSCLALHECEDGFFQKSFDEILCKLNEFAVVLELAKNFDSRVKKIVRDELVKSDAPVSVPGKKDVTNSEPRWNLRSASRKRKLEAENQNGSNGDETPKSIPSFAEVLKIKRAKKDDNVKTVPAERLKVKPNPVVVIQPRKGVDIGEKTAKKELKQKVNPKNLNVNRVIEGKDGAVIVVVKDDESSQKLKESVEKEMGDQFEVNVRDSMKPTVKIINISEEFNEDELKATLIEDNDVFHDLKHFKLRKFYRNEKRSYAQFTALVELDATTFFKVMELEKIFVGWDRCRVFDGLEVPRCFKCCKYNHKIAECKAEVDTCPKCCGNHRGKDCKSTVEKCANCERDRVEGNLDVETDHAVWSTNCPVYQRFIKRLNKRIDYTA